LVVERDERLALQTSSFLAHHGLAARWCGDGKAALASLRDEEWDVVLLDLALPDMDALEMCRRVRRWSRVPIIAVSRAAADAAKVAALEAGVDDYLTIPFSFPEMVARVKAIARRARGDGGTSAQTVRVGQLLLEAAALRVTLDGKAVAVTSNEFALLWALAQAAGQVVTRDRLLDWTREKSDEVFDRSVDVNISRLRQKLGDDPRHPRLIKTVRGEGYLLAADTDRSGPV